MAELWLHDQGFFEAKGSHVLKYGHLRLDPIEMFVVALPRTIHHQAQV